MPIEPPSSASSVLSERRPSFTRGHIGADSHSRPTSAKPPNERHLACDAASAKFVRSLSARDAANCLDPTGCANVSRGKSGCCTLFRVRQLLAVALIEAGRLINKDTEMHLLVRWQFRPAQGQPGDRCQGGRHHLRCWLRLHPAGGRQVGVHGSPPGRVDRFPTWTARRGRSLGRPFQSSIKSDCRLVFPELLCLLPLPPHSTATANNGATVCPGARWRVR